MNKTGLFLVALCWGWSAQAAQPAQDEHSKSHDMGKMWQTSLARQPLAVNATLW